MDLQLPSSYPNDYWKIVREKLYRVAEDPSLDQLLQLIQDISEIQCCPHVRGITDTDKLSRLFRSYCKHKEKLEGMLIAVICALALNIEELFQDGSTETLKSSLPGSLSLSATQVHCLLAHMFLGTFRCCFEGELVEKRHAHGSFSFASRMSFVDWFHIKSYPTTDIYIYALLNMFEECISSKSDNRMIIFERRVLEHKPDLNKCNFPLITVNVHSQGRIGDIEEIEVDFANACVGGGPSGTQEELLLGTSPETLPIAILNADPLLENESIIMTGAKKFADYKGYGMDATYNGNNIQNWDWSCRKIIAIDAMYFDGFSGDNRLMQMQEKLMKREINKCFIGFEAAKEHGVSTGHWGCGAFGGDKEIKAIIQVIGASIAQVKHLNFFTFGDVEFADDFKAMMDALYQNDVRVNQLWDILLKESRLVKEPVTAREKYDPAPYLFKKIFSDLHKM